MVRLAASRPGGTLLGGISSFMICGLASDVVRMKNVMSRNARSTIAVKSTRGWSLFPEPLLPPFLDAVNSAMIFSFRYFDQ
jgi:hypothetical protein